MTTLTNGIEQRRMIQEMPVDELSASIMEFEDKMAQLDEIGVLELTEMVDEDGKQILTLAEAQKMVGVYRKEAHYNQSRRCIYERKRNYDFGFCRYGSGY